MASFFLLKKLKMEYFVVFARKKKKSQIPPSPLLGEFELVVDELVVVAVEGY